MQLVIAAITTCPWSSSTSVPSSSRQHCAATADRGRRPARRRCRRRRRLGAPGRGAVAVRAPADPRPGTTPSPASSSPCAGALSGSQPCPAAPSGTTPWTRSATRGPAGASGRRATARPRRGRARASRSRSAPRSPRRATGPARARTPRRASMCSCVAAGERQVAQRLGVDREHRAGRAELRAHVADRRAVGERQVRHAGAVELDELADHAVLAQHLRDGEHEVGRGRALGQRAVRA